MPGIGPGLLAVIGPHLTFSGVVRAAELSAGPGPVSAPAEPALLDLNAATVAELERLPGIGPSRARDIVADRERHGSFSRVADLDRIPGIGPAAVARLSTLVRVH